MNWLSSMPSPTKAKFVVLRYFVTLENHLAMQTDNLEKRVCTVNNLIAINNEAGEDFAAAKDVLIQFVVIFQKEFIGRYYCNYCCLTLFTISCVYHVKPMV